MPDPPALEARPAVARIAGFAAATRPERLAPDVRQLLKRNILYSLGCAIAALAHLSRRCANCSRNIARRVAAR
jgi:2-methylcitrate dehydratase